MVSWPSTTSPKTTCLPSSLVERNRGGKVRTGQDTPQHGSRSVLTHGHSQFFCSPWSLFCADEELGTIGVGACIGHGQDATASVFQGKVLILKLVAINWPATSSIVVREVTSLYPKVSRLELSVKKLLRSQKAIGTKSFIPGTWSRGWHDGRWILCSHSQADLCTTAWSSLQDDRQVMSTFMITHTHKGKVLIIK